ncbi:ribosome silencing factor [Ammonifex thiophilus]|uniref:Ribosomal silencing factor RsfS n=1 Tax=Ammonifex thiophilus TaxID=444093 RepID=A0A3D8P4Y7_9THEO|nr:ribosome silencing factor [Ammonifex thiophilus]
MKVKPREIVDLIIEAAQEKKGYDILALEVGKLLPLCDYFVILSGNNPIQVKAIAEHIEKKLAEQGVNLLHREGFQEGRWILLDFGDVVVHVFLEEEREFYGLERLWRDAPVFRKEAAQFG